MKITAFGLARSLGARRILQLILHLPNFLKLCVRLLKGSAGVADLENHTIGYRGLRVVSC